MAGVIAMHPSFVAAGDWRMSSESNRSVAIGSLRSAMTRTSIKVVFGLSLLTYCGRESRETGRVENPRKVMSYLTLVRSRPDQWLRALRP